MTFPVLVGQLCPSSGRRARNDQAFVDGPQSWNGCLCTFEHKRGEGCWRPIWLLVLRHACCNFAETCTLM